MVVQRGGRFVEWLYHMSACVIGLSLPSRASQSKAVHQTQTGHQKLGSITGKWDSRLFEQLSTVPDKVYLFAFLKNLAFLSPRTWRFIFVPPPIWMICAPVLFVVSGPVPLTDILCCASSPRGSALDVTKECITSECVVCCVWAVKRTGETFRDVLAGRFPRVHAFHCSYTPPLVPFNRTSGKLRCSFVDGLKKN